MGAPQLNIKDAEVTAMVRELAELTGESQTEAVRKAVKERLRRTKARHPAVSGQHRTARAEAERIIKKLESMQDRASRRIKRTDLLADDDLYDELGLPK